MSTTFRLGLFVLAGLLILSAGVFLIGDKEQMFSKTYEVKATFPNVAGLNAGADVRVAGIHQGTVKRIDLPHHPKEPVVVAMILAKPTRDVVKKDSVATIKSEGLLGDKYVEISFGSPDQETLKGGETIQSESPIDFSDLAKKASAILDTTKDAVTDIQGTASNLNAVSGKINDGKGTIGALVNDKKIYTEAAAGAASFHDNMEALKHNFLLRGFFNNRGYTDAAELKRNEIARLPAEASMKSFRYDAGRLFEKPESAKFKSEKMLNEAGKALEAGNFGLAVITVAGGQKGDSEKEQVLTQARAMVVRDYLISNFRLDDTRIKTMGLGKSADATTENGKVEILVYPPSTKEPVTRAQAGK